MKSENIFLLFGASLLAISLSCIAIASPDKERAAAASAYAWLMLVDEGRYPESWEAAASYFKTAIAKKEWGKALNAARKPLGRLISRELKSTAYASSLPGAPDGEYVVIQYTTSFENKKSGIETITPMLESDGVWRVSGYFIR